ncbi:MAG: metalloprotease [Ilumatobacteraceae bacterium]
MFRLLGFDVRVRLGFVIFMVLIIGLHGNEFGLWLAGSIAVFTLVHELGHAVAARRNGAEAEISLDFLAGYTSFAATRPLSKAQRALISFAGPGVHIAASLAVLAAMGVNPIDGDSYNRSDAAAAIWWAGPVIGLFNLIPVLPLDGGHIAQTALEVVFGTRAKRAMVIASLAVTGAVAVWCFADDDRRGFAIFVVFLMFAQFQMLGATSVSGPRRSIAAAADAERSAWLTGRSGMMLPGQELSPWLRAHRALQARRPDEARSVLLADLTSEGPRRWFPPDAATPEQLRPLVQLLPHPYPAGNPLSEYVLADVLLRTGDRVTAGHYAAASFSRSRSSVSAIAVARAAAAMGDRDTAISWLHAAAAASPASQAANVAEAIDHAPELAVLRDDPEIRRLRAALTSA